MTIYGHVSNKEDVPGQAGYFMQLLKIRRDAFGTITEDEVTTLRYMVAGSCFMRAARVLSAKQGRWEATHLPTVEQAHQMLRETVNADTEPTDPSGRIVEIVRVTELTVGLDELDLIAIDGKHKNGVEARWRPCHWVKNHIGQPVVVDNRTVEYEGGSD